MTNTQDACSKRCDAAPCPPRRRIITLIVTWLAIACIQPATASDLASESRQDTWMALFVNGHKSGYLHSIRETDENTVRTTQNMRWTLKRNGVSMQIEVTETSRETRTGRPISFHSRQRLSGVTQETSGIMDAEGRLKLTKTGVGPPITATVPWQEDWVMAEGHRLRQLQHFRRGGMKPGTQLIDWVFSPGLEKAVKTISTLGPLEDVDLLGNRQTLYHVKEIADFGFMRHESEAWLDKDFHVKKMRTSMMGMTLEMIACPKPCATAEDTPFEAFTTTVIDLGRHLDRHVLERPIRWTFRLKRPADTLTLVNSQEQRSDLTTNEAGEQILVVTVDPKPAAIPATVALTVPKAGELEQLKQPTAWMQSQADLIIELAEKNVRSDQSDKQKMNALTQFARHYINDKNLSVAYASALETAQHRNGDCTEHALLTGALGRAAGIPTRIVTGLAYVPELEGRKNVLVPHAWTQAWINGRWHSFDAALGQFGSGHIALSHGNGDPLDFYNSILLLGNLIVESVDPL